MFGVPFCAHGYPSWLAQQDNVISGFYRSYRKRPVHGLECSVCYVLKGVYYGLSGLWSWAQGARLCGTWSDRRQGADSSGF